MTEKKGSMSQGRPGLGPLKDFLYEIRALLLAVVLWGVPWLIIRHGFHNPHIPAFVRTMYLVLITVGVLLYLSVNEKRLQGFIDSLKRVKMAGLILPPLMVGSWVLGSLAPTFQLPAERSIVHSTPPLEFVGLDNPLTNADPTGLPNDNPYIRYGEALYQNNCRWCHGKDADGKGEAYEGFRPLPANFKDTGTIAQLKQSYLLWRITEGGWEEPFMSAMPKWNDDIDDDEKWAIILYEYHHAGVSPRKAEQ